MFTKLGKILIQNISSSDKKYAFLPIVSSNDLPFILNIRIMVELLGIYLLLFITEIFHILLDQ